MAKILKLPKPPLNCLSKQDIEESDEFKKLLAEIFKYVNKTDIQHRVKNVRHTKGQYDTRSDRSAEYRSLRDYVPGDDIRRI